MEKSELSQIKQEYFSGKFFTTEVMKFAGRVLKKDGKDATVKYLTEHQLDCKPADFQPPVKCRILFTSRSFDQWPIRLASIAVQKYVYNLSLNDFKTFSSKTYTSKANQHQFFQTTGVDNCNYTAVQGLCYIFRMAFLLSMRTKISKQ
jgi:hypothetical protein